VFQTKVVEFKKIYLRILSVNDFDQDQIKITSIFFLNVNFFITHSYI